MKTIEPTSPTATDWENERVPAWDWTVGKPWDYDKFGTPAEYNARMARIRERRRAKARERYAAKKAARRAEEERTL